MTSHNETNEVSAAIGGDTFFVEGAGHYPHVEAPESFLARVLDFIEPALAS